MTIKNDPKQEILDVLIKTTRHDIVPYLQLQSDLLKHSSLQGQVYVTVPAQDYELFRSRISAAFELVTDQHILSLAHYDDPVEDNWFTQQLIKLLSFVVVRHEAYLVVDANTLINKDFSESEFRVQGEWVYALENDFANNGWERNSRRFLGLSPTPIAGFRPVNQVFVKRNVQSLLQYIEHRHQAQAVTVLLRSHRQSYDTDVLQWTEYNLYGAFSMFVARKSGHMFHPQSVVYFDPLKAPAIKAQILREIRNKKPLMVKVYKRRPLRHIAIREYQSAVEQVKACYHRHVS
jgi:hypothetical protein